MDNVYFTIEDSLDACKCRIVSRDTDLRIRVLRMRKCPFSKDKNEIQMYAYHRNELLAFETIDIQPEDAIDVIEAISWYCRNIVHNQNMEILPYNPQNELENVAI